MTSNGDYEMKPISVQTIKVMLRNDPFFHGINVIKWILISFFSFFFFELSLIFLEKAAKVRIAEANFTKMGIFPY